MAIVTGTWASEVLNAIGSGDTIYGLDGNDTITGSAAGDILVGGSGNDLMRGGDGDDLFQVNKGDGADSFDGGDGYDTVVAMADDMAIGIGGHYVNAVEEISAGGKSGVSIRGDWSSQTLDFSATFLNGITAINGGDGNDTIIGSVAGDVIIGASGNDALKGGDGDDIFQIGKGDGADSFDGGTGYDTVVATVDDMAIGLGGHYANTVEEISAGGKSGVSIRGDWSSQTLDFSATFLNGITAINGGDGNDTITGSAAGDVILGGTGNDTLKGGEGDDLFHVNSGDGADSFDGGNGYDKVVAMADDIAIGLGGHYAGTVEEFSANGKSGVSIHGDWSSQTLDFSATVLTGIVSINGGDGNDTITGSAAGDVILGGTGNDTLKGGDGDDLFHVNSGDGADSFDGGNGYDKAVAMADDMAIGLGGHYANTVEEFSAGGRTGVSIRGDWSSQALDFSKSLLTGIVSINGADGNDTITGSASGDVIIGGSGNDKLNGGEGDDIFQIGMGDGADSFDGGAGYDRVVATADNVAIGIGGHYANTVEEFSSGGKANVTIHGDWSSQALDFSATLLTGIASINGGDGNDSITGSASGDVIFGGSGNDVLKGGEGDDRLHGGTGADYLQGGNGIDTVDYRDASAAIVTSLAGTGTAGDAARDRYSSIENLSGSNFDDVLGGDAGNNRLVGRQGADQLSGGAGNDTLVGGSGYDSLDGGSGVDTADYSGSWGSVTVDLSTGKGSGAEAAKDTLVNIENVTGSGFDDKLTGDASVNRLVGGSGNDTLAGNGGNDILVGGAGADSLDGGLGDRDAVDYQSASAGVSLSLATGGTGGEAAGDSFTGIEFVYGSGFGDVITGNDAVNRLVGQDGDDMLDGGRGNDYLLGGLGDDALTGGQGNDVFVFEGAFGTDTLTDFAAGAGRTDRIWLTGMGIADYADLAAHYMSVNGSGHAVITIDGLGSITLTGVAAANLVADDFIFS